MSFDGNATDRKYIADGGLIHQRRERADAAKEASPGFTQDLAGQHRAGKPPPIAYWYGELGRAEDQIGTFNVCHGGISVNMLRNKVT